MDACTYFSTKSPNTDTWPKIISASMTSLQYYHHSHLKLVLQTGTRMFECLTYMIEEANPFKRDHDPYPWPHHTWTLALYEAKRLEWLRMPHTLAVGHGTTTAGSLRETFYHRVWLSWTPRPHTALQVFSAVPAQSTTTTVSSSRPLENVTIFLPSTSMIINRLVSKYFSLYRVLPCLKLSFLPYVSMWASDRYVTPRTFRLLRRVRRAGQVHDRSDDADDQARALSRWTARYA